MDLLTKLHSFKSAVVVSKDLSVQELVNRDVRYSRFGQHAAQHVDDKQKETGALLFKQQETIQIMMINVVNK